MMFFSELSSSADKKLGQLLVLQIHFALVGIFFFVSNPHCSIKWVQHVRSEAE